MSRSKEETGALVRHRWCSNEGQKIDFVIAPSPPEAETGKLQNLTHDLAAIKMLGMDLALKHRREVSLSGCDLRGRSVTRSRDFGTIDDRGPKDVCRFLDESLDEDRAASVLAQVAALLEAFDSER